MLTAASVCSGIGAPECAWHPLGITFAFCAEIEPFPSAVLRHHYPEVPNLGDFTRICPAIRHDADDQHGELQQSAARRSMPSAGQFGTRSDGGNGATVAADTFSPGSIDLLAGGTPCQDFSVAGLRAGMDGKRGQLTVEFALLAGRLRPKWLVWENVPGILSIDEGRAFGIFLRLLGELGYGFAYRVLDAQYFGVAQRRRRVFVVGCLGDWRSAAAVLFERQSLSGHPAPRREARERPAPTISARTNAGGGLGTDFDCDGVLVPVQFVPETTACLDANYGKLRGCSHNDANHKHSHLVAYGGNNTSGPIGVATAIRAHTTFRGDFDSETFIAHSLRGDGFDASEDGTGRGTPLVTHSLSASHSSTEDGTGRAMPPLAVAFTECTRADGRNLESQEELAYALTNPGNGGRAQERQIMVPIATFEQNSLAGRGTLGYSEEQLVRPVKPQGDHQMLVMPQMAVRRLTPRECERLQGFPDDYTLIEYNGKLAADGPRYKALGNAMAVPVMRWIGERILMVEEMTG